MNLKRLQAFRAMMELGSVTLAAERLHMSQPAVSRLITELEAELGLTLFARQRRRLVPTVDGKQFYHQAERALAAIDQIVDAARDVRTLKGARLRLVSTMAPAFGMVPAMLAAFAAKHPEVAISLAIRDPQEIEDWVATGPFDLGIAMAPIETSAVTSEPLTTVDAVVVLPPEHPLVGRAHLEAADLKDAAMIMPASPSPIRMFIEHAVMSGGDGPRCIIETPAAISACQMVGLGLGVTLTDPFSAAASKDRLVTRRFRPSVEMAYVMFTPANRPRNRLADLFMSLAKAVVVELANGFA